MRNSAGWATCSGGFSSLRRAHVKGRRPIVLFGDSFSACTPDVQCFEGHPRANAILSQDFAVLIMGGWIRHRSNHDVDGTGVAIVSDAIVVLGMMTLDIDRAHLRLERGFQAKV